MSKGIPKNGINKGWFVKGSKLSKEICLKISEANRKKIYKPLSEETKRKISLGQMGRVLSEETKERIRQAHLKRVLEGKHNTYKQDRSTLSKKQERNDMSYKDWRKQVWLRDKFTCRIADNNCDGRIEAHHILGWSEHPELRYQINNGITLCHAHHPRKRAEEKRSIPTFTELVSMSVSKK